jgi:hypothetical protein
LKAGPPGKGPGGRLSGHPPFAAGEKTGVNR